MRKKIKMIPTILMLMAGAITSIICYILKYEVMTMLLILIGVMILFYIVGDVIRYFLAKYVYPPKEEADEETEEALDEGAVIEKETAEEVDTKTKKHES